MTGPRFALVLAALVIGLAPGQQPAPKEGPAEPLSVEKLAAMKARYEAIPRSSWDFLTPDSEAATEAMRWYLDHPDLANTRSVEWFEACELIANQKFGLPGSTIPTPAPKMSYFDSYYSAIDGSMQPFGVRLPAGAKKWTPDLPIEVVLHGCDDTLQPAKFIAQFADPKRTSPNDAVQLEVFGRGNNAFRWAGETDVFEAIDACGFLSDRMFDAEGNKLPPVRKPVIRGFSMGGAGAWHLGLHYPDRWRAVQPGVGFTMTHGHANGLPKKLEEPREKLLTIYDAFRYAENVREVPVIAYSGSEDKQKAAADLIEERLKKLRESQPEFKDTMKHVIAPGLGHEMPLEWRKKIDAVMAEQIKKRARDPFPETVEFVTYTLKYPSCEWIEILGMGEHYKRASFKVTRAKDVVSVVTENIRALRLHAPKGKSLPNSVAVIEHNVRKPMQLALPADTTDIALIRVKDGKWRIAPYADWVEAEKKSPTKQPGLDVEMEYNLFSEPGKGTKYYLRHLRQTGPIDDAFTQPFTVYRPTEKPKNAVVAKAIDAELVRFRREWRRYMMGDLPEFDPPMIRWGKREREKCASALEQADRFDPDEGMSVVLFGDPQSNPCIRKLLPKLPLAWTADKIVIKGKEFDAKTHYPVLIYPNPLAPGGGYIVINSGMTFGEKEFKASNAMLFPKLGDYAIIEAATGVVKLNGLFDEDWK